jgi:hypothetical protein
MIPRVWSSLQYREIPQLVRIDVVNRRLVRFSWWDSYNTIEYVLITNIRLALSYVKSYQTLPWFYRDFFWILRVWASLQYDRDPPQRVIHRKLRVFRKTIKWCCVMFRWNANIYPNPVRERDAPTNTTLALFFHLFPREKPLRFEYINVFLESEKRVNLTNLFIRLYHNYPSHYLPRCQNLHPDSTDN